MADTTTINQLRTRYAATPNSHFILTVNSLHPRKRIDYLIRAMPIILQSYPDTRALIVGVGPERARLQHLCTELRIASQVVLTGFVPEACLSAYYALADVYVHTTRNESLGLAIIEAAAAGLPVVAVNEGGVGETIVHAETGLLVPAEPSALGAAVRSLLANPQRARQMGAAGQARVNRLNRWELAAQEFMQVWTAARERKHV